MISVINMMCLTWKGYISENGGSPAPPQGQKSILGHSRADTCPQLAVGQLTGLHLGPDQFQWANHCHGSHCKTDTKVSLKEHCQYFAVISVWGVFVLFHALTSGKTPSNKRDMTALKTHTESQEVPQLVVAGEVNDSGRYCHHPVNINKQRFRTEELYTLQHINGKFS